MEVSPVLRLSPSFTLDFLVVFESNASAHYLKSRKIVYDKTNQIKTLKDTFLIFIYTKSTETSP